MHEKRKFCALFIPLTIAAGCSSARPPQKELGAAEVAVRQAQTSQAAVAAPAELRMASDKLEKARVAMRDKRYDDARQLAEEALVDAQLAEAKAHGAQAQKMAREMRENIAALQREADRGVR